MLYRLPLRGRKVAGCESDVVRGGVLFIVWCGIVE
jgi:hypothetical protein